MPRTRWLACACLLLTSCVLGEGFALQLYSWSVTSQVTVSQGSLNTVLFSLTCGINLPTLNLVRITYTIDGDPATVGTVLWIESPGESPAISTLNTGVCPGKTPYLTAVKLDLDLIVGAAEPEVRNITFVAESGNPNPSGTSIFGPGRTRREVATMRVVIEPDGEAPRFEVDPSSTPSVVNSTGHRVVGRISDNLSVSSLRSSVNGEAERDHQIESVVTPPSALVEFDATGTRRFRETVLDFDISVDGLRLGPNSVELIASDAAGNVDTYSYEVFSDPPNDPPIVTITRPDLGQEFPEGALVRFEGSAVDPNGDDVPASSFAWSSDLQGDLGVGPILGRDDLQPGTHVVTLTAMDARGLPGSATVTFTVRGNAPPVVIIHGPLQGTVIPLGRETILVGSATDQEDGGEVPDERLAWSSDKDGGLGVGGTVRVPNLSAGTHEIRLSATDGSGGVGTKTVQVRVNRPPVLVVSSPTDGMTIVRGTPLSLVATAVDPEDGPLPPSFVIWESVQQGRLGVGTDLTVTNLVVGTHSLVVATTDLDQSTTRVFLSITVLPPPPTNQPPTAAITAPADGSTHVQGTSVALQGTGTDAEDGVLTSTSLSWTSSLDGPLGTGGNLALTTLSPGTHAITLTATDSDLATGAATIVLTVTPAVPTNQAPVVAITSPSGGDAFAGGYSVPFNGAADDPEDGALSGASLVWTSDRDGQLATGVFFESRNLSIGVHQVTLTATDSNGASGSATITITVYLNDPPTVQITSPADGTRLMFGQSTTFTGTATDPQDGPLTGFSLFWSAEPGGSLGFGSSVANSTLSPGPHLILLMAIDNDGAVTTDTINVIVVFNAPPTAQITAPSNGISVVVGSSVTFRGSANDPESGALTGTALEWWSSQDGLLGTGQSLTTAELTVGTHQIELRATDPMGASGSDYLLTVTVTATLPTP